MEELTHTVSHGYSGDADIAGSCGNLKRERVSDENEQASRRAAWLGKMKSPLRREQATEIQ